MTLTLVVVNPHSAGGRTGAAWPALEAELRRAGVEFDVHRTGARGEATEVTRAALAGGASRIVACGGDGTLNEIVNGFLDPDGRPVATDAVLAVLPSGTGGDFAKSAGIPSDPAGAAAVLARGESRVIDAGRVDFPDGTHRSFVNVADCGVGGEVVRRVNAARRKPRGKLPYLLAVAGTVLTYPAVHARVEVDGTAVEGAVASIVIANGGYFGGGMHVAPQADLADGQLDVILGTAGRLASLAGSRRLYSGEHIGHPGTIALRGAEVRITPLGSRAMPFDVDGEHVGAAPAAIRVLPGALRLCAPPAR